MSHPDLDFFEQAMEITLQLTHVVSVFPVEMWQLLAHIHTCYDAGAACELEYLVGVLDNFMSRFPDQYLNPPTGDSPCMKVESDVREEPS